MIGWQNRMAIAIALGFVAAAAAPGADEPATRPSGKVDLPHAGISLILPENVTFSAPAEPSVLFSASVERDDGPALTVSLSALVVDEGATAETAAERMLSSLRQNIDFTEVELLKRVDAPIAGCQGVLEVLSYVVRGDARVATRSVWLRDVPGGENLCYVLSCETASASRSGIMPVFRSLLGSLKLTEIRSPVALPVRRCGAAVTDSKLGYRLAVPLGWYVHRTRRRTAIAQTSYLDGGSVVRSARVTRVRERTAETPEAFLDLCQRTAQDKSGVQMVVVSSSPAELGGVKGLQRVLAPDVPQDAVTEESPAAAASELAVHRVVVVDTPDGRAVYGLLLAIRTNSVPVAQRVADELARGLTFLNAGATTRPAKDSAAADED